MGFMNSTASPPVSQFVAHHVGKKDIIRPGKIDGSPPDSHRSDTEASIQWWVLFGHDMRGV